MAKILTYASTDSKVNDNWNSDHSALRRRHTTGICSPKSAVRIHRIGFRSRAGQRPQEPYLPEPSPVQNNPPGISRPHLPHNRSAAIRRSIALPSGGLYRVLYRPAHSALPTSIRRTADQQHYAIRVFNSTTTHRIAVVMISPCS